MLGLLEHRSLLRRMSQARSVDTVLDLAKAIDQRSYETKGFQELKASIRNLSSISSMTWEAREKLPYIYHQIENDKNITSKMDARARNLITMSNLSVHSLGGITSSSFRVLLSWYGDDGRSDLDLYLKCPECNCLVSHKDRICKCCEEIHLTVEKVGDEKSSNLGVEMVDVSSPTGRNNFSKCIQSITKGGILDEAATQKGIQLQIGDPIDLEADGIRLLRPKLSRVEFDVDHLGPSQMRSVQNAIVQQASNETYSLQVHLFAGDPVAYEVLVQRVGFPDVLYQLPPHAETDEMEDIFSMSGLQLQSKWEPLELD